MLWLKLKNRQAIGNQMTMLPIRCDIHVNIPEIPLDFEILVNDVSIYKISTTKTSYNFVYDIDDSIINEHQLKFIMSGKTDDHAVEKDGVIVDSANINITNISFNEINLSILPGIMRSIASYTHDFNGYGDTVTEEFYGEMGANGVATLNFKTPLYELLLIKHIGK